MASGVTPSADHQPPDWVRQAQDTWTNRGQDRPSFAIEPGPNQESVWDYPRPPALVNDGREVIVRAGDVMLAQATRSLRLLETASPPTFYLPPESITANALVPCPGASMCEWKGPATYLAVASAPDDAIGWTYPQAWAPFDALSQWVAFYPGRVSCTVDGETVRPQPGHFYGGWITDDVVGPFKGESGTSGW